MITADALLGFKAYRRNDISFWYWIDAYSKPGSWEDIYTMPLSEASIHQIFLHHYASQICDINIDGSASRKYTDQEIIDVFADHPDVQTLDYFTRQCNFNPDHPGNHMNWWTEDKVCSFLAEAGFSDVYRSGWGQSVFRPLRNTSLFDSTHPRISLFVEATK